MQIQQHNFLESFKPQELFDEALTDIAANASEEAADMKRCRSGQ